MIVATIAQIWDSFEKDVMPKDANAFQRQEMRRAFYSGCWGMLMAMKHLGALAVSEADGVVAMKSWEQEMRVFYEKVKRGLA